MSTRDFRTPEPHRSTLVSKPRIRRIRPLLEKHEQKEAKWRFPPPDLMPKLHNLNLRPVPHQSVE